MEELICRQALFPVGFKRNEALEILLHFEGNNRDGFGYSYVKENGDFFVYKSVLPLSTLLKRSVPILSHMPHNNGYTLCHLRQKSCGELSRENSHPFLTEKYSTSTSSLQL